MVNLPFQDRMEAGRLLGAELASRNIGLDAIVLALPRGGLPVGAEVAKALNAPLDVVLVRKLGVPWEPELAMGAIAGDFEVLDHQLIREFGISEAEVEAVAAREAKEIERRASLFRGGRPAPDVHGRTVVLVDDGLATGSTMLVAARYVHSLHPRKLIIAVPVGSIEAYRRLSKEADQCICLASPERFYAVGEWYKDFQQVTDPEVQQILEETHKRAEPVV